MQCVLGAYAEYYRRTKQSKEKKVISAPTFRLGDKINTAQFARHHYQWW
jgi:hypothetical protein